MTPSLHTPRKINPSSALASAEDDLITEKNMEAPEEVEEWPEFDPNSGRPYSELAQFAREARAIELETAALFRQVREQIEGL